MTKEDFIQRMNKAGDEIHRLDGDYYTCNLVGVIGTNIRTSFASFLKDCFPETKSHFVFTSYLFDRDMHSLNESEKKSIYELRVMVLAVFTASVLKTGQYLEF